MALLPTRSAGDFDRFAALGTHTGINAQTVSYTLTADDRGAIVTMTSGSGLNCTIPLNATVPFPIGTSIIVIQGGAGAVTLVATGGVTLVKKAATLASGAANSVIVIRKIAVDTWNCSGDLA